MPPGGHTGCANRNLAYVQLTYNMYKFVDTKHEHSRSSHKYVPTLYAHASFKCPVSMSPMTKNMLIPFIVNIF
jgi:hypothetical protein